MASRDERDAAAVRIHPPLVPLLAILGGIGLERLVPLDPAPGFPAPARYWIPCLQAKSSTVAVTCASRTARRYA